MHLRSKDDGAKSRLNISAAALTFGPAKPAAAIKRGALALAVLSALLHIAARPAGAQTESILWVFTGPSGGGSETRLTPDGAGSLYGVAGGGSQGGTPIGIVFKLSPNGSGGWSETTLYQFCFNGSSNDCTDGLDPSLSYLIFDKKGNLYGTTFGGGADNDGTVFELSPEPKGGCPNGSNKGTGWCETVLYSFASSSDRNPDSGWSWTRRAISTAQITTA